MKYFTKKDLKNLTADDLYPLTYVASQNLSAIYRLFGWDMNIRWLKNDGEPEETLKMLINNCIEELKKGKDETSCATGGMKVEMWIEEDFIHLEVYYSILEF